MRRAALLAIALGACGGAPPRATPAPDVDLAYAVTLESTLDLMQVSVCPRGASLPTALVPIHDEGAAHVRAAALVLDGAVLRALAPSARIALSDVPPRACVRYEVDLADCATPASMAGCARVGADLFAPTSVWLLAPETRRLSARYSLDLALPPGVSVTPITDDGAIASAHVSLDDRAFAFVTYLAFVHHPPERIAVAGGCIDVAMLGSGEGTSREARTHWLSAAARSSARVTGRTPFTQLTAIVVPTLDVPGTPVLFGVAGRGMRPTVTLFVSPHASEAELVPDWTLVHELSHFLTAYVEGQDAWLSEGLATYYEEVLRAREGLITESQAWAALVGGFGRGRAESGERTLREAARSMHETHAYARVYWAGAAIAFLADVAYRRAGSSLDEAIARAWPHRTERASAAELALWLDGAPEGPLASVVATTLDARDFPDVGETLAWLGVASSNGEVSFVEDAPGAALRRALMNGGSPVTSNPASCDVE